MTAPSAPSLPTVSVVIPTRDRPELLRRCIRDILAQDYPGSIEIIAVFDQSEPDESLERTSHNRTVRAIFNDRTPGLAGGRNTGVMAATGDLISFCDDDDEWLPAKLSAQVALLNSIDEPAVVACGIYIKRGDRTTLRLPDSEGLRYEDFLEGRIMEVNPCTILLAHDLMVDKIGLVDETLPGSYAEDYEWLLRASKLATIAVVPEPLAVIHWGVGSFFSERWQMIHDAIDDLVAKHPDLRNSDRGYARLRGQQAIALAGMGQRREALKVAAEASRLNRRELRSVAAVAVASGVISGNRLVRIANSMGRGV